MVLELFHEEHQLRTAGQAVGTLNIKSIDFSLDYQIPKPIQAGPHEIVPAITFIGVILAVQSTIFTNTGPQLLKLALDSLLVFLAVR